MTGQPAYIPSRYKYAYGGRGSGKSQGFAGTAAYLGAHHPLRIVCAREIQSSIRESVHQLVSERIAELGLDGYTVHDHVIRHANGTEFIFIGLKNDPAKHKSLQGADILWIEEADKISKNSWQKITPTIRKPGSEIWVTFNPENDDDETYKRLVLRRPPDSRGVFVNFDSNPWFPKTLELERQDLLAQINEAEEDEERSQLQADYDHVWLGACAQRTAATIFRSRVVIHEFDEPKLEDIYGGRIRFGADWGFANDPTAAVRLFITDHVQGDRKWQELWISHEKFGWHVEIDDLAEKVFDQVPGTRQWPIKADSARPETISYVARQGFNCTAAEKWPGSLEDGIAHVKGYRKIHIHKRCTNLQREARLYRYKVDPRTGEVLPVVVDKHNHGWDGVRYALDGEIQRRGASAQWLRLAQ